MKLFFVMDLKPDFEYYNPENIQKGCHTDHFFCGTSKQHKLK